MFIPRETLPNNDNRSIVAFRQEKRWMSK